jgi:TRAP-type mannitol/chloroaromatic compound transport system permease large subunit
MLALSVIVCLLVLLASGAPVGFSSLIAGAIGLLLKGGIPMVLGIFSTSPAAAASSYELITIPMFMLMAQFVILSGVANSLCQRRGLGRARSGGLGVATARGCGLCGDLAGSSTASAATLASTTIPGMLKQGYEPKLACGIVSISGTLAMLIPPSVALVLYGIVANVSIGKLLIAGIIPGILVTLTIVLTIFYLVWRDPSVAPEGRAYSWREKFSTLGAVGPMLWLFMAVTGLVFPASHANGGLCDRRVWCLSAGALCRSDFAEVDNQRATRRCALTYDSRDHLRCAGVRVSSH